MRLLIPKKYSPRALPQLLWNSPTFTTWGSFITTSLKGLILYPFILTRFDTEEVATWLLFLSAIALSNLMDLGFLGSFSRQIAYAMGGVKSTVRYQRDYDYGKDVSGVTNWELMGKLYGTMGYIFVGLGLMALLLLSTFGTLAVARTIAFNTDPNQFWAAWWVIVASVSVGIYGRKYRTVLHGMNYIPLMNRWNIFFNSTGVVAAIAVLYIFNSILALVIVTQTFSILSILRDRYLLKHVVEEKRFKDYPSFFWEPEIFRAVYSPTWRSALGMFASGGVTEITGIIYAQVANAEMLAAYLLALRLINLVSAASRAPFYSKVPLFTRYRAEGKIEALIKNTKRSMAIALYVFILGILTVGQFVEPLLSLLQTEVTFVPLSLWLLMSNVWFLERHHAMHAQTYGTMNHEPFYIPITISGAINITLALLLLKPLDVWAFPVAQGFSNLLINNWWNVKISLRSLGQPAFSYMKTSFILPLIAFIGFQMLLFVARG
ncbi:MAG: hypothetical protein FVQ79_01840 [Planctomycetes bacterium]|nr:hypothetical protein [Planctomycetota bacterium]